MREIEAQIIHLHLGDCAACLGRLDALVGQPDSLVAALRRPGAGDNDNTALDQAVAAVLCDGSPTWVSDTLSEPEPGGELSGYHLLEELGRGGMGRVYRAVHPRLDQEVALKVLHPGMDSGPILARFQAECHALALMDDPHIARILDSGVTPAGTPFFVMELVQGRVLTSYCDKRRLDFRRRLELFVQVCQGVQHAHQKGIIHRDLKPSNVLVAEYEGVAVPKVIDFGVARAVDRRSTAATEVGMVIGTPEYMSPEQADLLSHDVDTRSDIFSLGVLLYELLTGDTPLRRRQAREAPLQDVLRAIREEEPTAPSDRLAETDTLEEVAARRSTPPGKLVRQIRGELDWIVLKCLEKERSRRYEMAAALAEDVQRFLNNEPVRAGPRSRLYRLRKFVRRNRGAVAAAVVVLTALFAGIAGTTAGMLRAREAEKLAGQRLEDALNEKSKAQQERDATRAVSDFLVHDLLGQASTYRQHLLGEEIDPDIKLRTALDRAVKLNQGRLAAHPRVEARLRNVIGRTYNRLGDHAAARPHLERAWQLTQQLDEPDDGESLAVMLNLAIAYQGLGEFQRAEPLFTELGKRGQAALGPGTSNALSLRYHQVRFLSYQGHLAEAEPLVRSLHDDCRRILGPTARLTLRVEGHLGLVLTRLRRFDQAEPLLTHAYRQHLDRFGPDDSSTWMNLSHLAEHYAARGQSRRATSLYHKVLDERQRLLGPEHPHTLLTSLQLGRLLVKQGALTRAYPLLSQALTGRRRRLGADHPETLNAQISVGLWHLRKKEFDAAEPLLTEALKLARTARGPNHLTTLDAINSLAKFHDIRRQYALAEPLYQEALTTLRRHPDLSPSMLNVVYFNYTTSLLEQRKYTLAEPLLRDYLEAARQRGWNDIRVGIARSGLGEVLTSQKRHAEAEPALLAGFEEIHRHIGKAPTSAVLQHLRKAVQRLVRLYDNWDKPDQAAKWRDRLPSTSKPEKSSP
jgi:serine/threonine protein kinase/tetratricopeptide (TPR) repeat protein